MTARWEHFAHEADMGVRGIGRTREEAFEQAALALTAVVADPSQVHPIEPETIECDGSDDEILFVDWLNALIFKMATRSRLYSRFEVQIADGRLQARAWGEPIDAKRHQPAVEVKGATYTALRVTNDNGVWTTQCIVDV